MLPHRLRISSFLPFWIIMKKQDENMSILLECNFRGNSWLGLNESSTWMSSYFLHLFCYTSSQPPAACSYIILECDTQKYLMVGKDCGRIPGYKMSHHFLCHWENMILKWKFIISIPFTGVVFQYSLILRLDRKPRHNNNISSKTTTAPHYPQFYNKGHVWRWTIERWKRKFSPFRFGWMEKNNNTILYCRHVEQ